MGFISVVCPFFPASASKIWAFEANGRLVQSQIWDVAIECWTFYEAALLASDLIYVSDCLFAFE